MKMTDTRMLALLEGMEVLLENELTIPIEPLVQCILRESHNMGVDGKRIRNIEPVSLARIDGFLQEVREQVTMHNFAGAITLIRQLRDMIERCGLQMRLPGPVWEDER